MTSCRPSGTADADVDVHAGLERDSRIVENEAHPHSARCEIDLRQDLIDAPVERAAGIGIDRDRGRRSRLQAPTSV